MKFAPSHFTMGDPRPKVSPAQTQHRDQSSSGDALVGSGPALCDGGRPQASQRSCVGVVATNTGAGVGASSSAGASAAVP